MKELQELWKTALAQIEVKLDSSAHFKTWFKNTILTDLQHKTATISVKNTYAAEWLNRKHNKMIAETISYIYGQEITTIKFKIDDTLPEVKPEKQIKQNNEKPLLTLEDGVNPLFKSALETSGLNPKYTFQSFIIGDSNNLAHAAALGTAEKPGMLYNPLFIYGKTGLGKTHLAQAVGRYVLDRNSSKKIVYVASETFLNDMIKAIRTGQNVDFRRKFRNVDVLIIDDIQLISKWPKTQIEFFNTFNVLHNAQKQIILISDVAPERLSDIDQRLRSRFQGGMVVEIYKPDLETRLAIITKKSIDMGITLPARIYEYIAGEITDNIRELEGSLQKIALFSSMIDYELSIEEVAKILGRDTKTKRDKIKLPEILKRIATEFDVTVKDIKGPKRTAPLAFARQVCMYILREEFKYKLEKTAALINRKDHTTVIHAVDKIKSKMMTDEGFKEQIEIIINDLNSGKFE